MASHSETLPQRFAFGGGKQSLNPPKISPKSSPELEPQLRKTAVPRLIRNPPLTAPKGCLWLRSASPKSRSPAGLSTAVEFLRRFAQRGEDSTNACSTKLELFFSVHWLFTATNNRRPGENYEDVFFLYLSSQAFTSASTLVFSAAVTCGSLKSACTLSAKAAASLLPSAPAMAYHLYAFT